MSSVPDASAVGLPSPELLLEAERRRLRALVACDIELARSLHAGDYELITPGGSTITGDEYLGDVASGELNYVLFEPASEIAIRQYEGAAALRYQARIEVRFADGVDSDLFWHTDIDEIRDGRWQVVWSQATRIRR
jgi:hypothetical protein